MNNVAKMNTADMNNATIGIKDLREAEKKHLRELQWNPIMNLDAFVELNIVYLEREYLQNRIDMGRDDEDVDYNSMTAIERINEKASDRMFDLYQLWIVDDSDLKLLNNGQGVRDGKGGFISFI